jgi:hypothetical protein
MTVKPFIRPLPGLLAILAAYALLRVPTMAQTSHPLIHDRDLTVPLPYFGILSFKWSGSLLLDRTDDHTSAPLLETVDREGRVERISFDIPGAAMVSVRSYAAGVDGALVLCGTAGGTGPRGTAYVAWISPDRKQRALTRVWPYVPEKVVLASDGTIWTAGYLHEEPGLGAAELNVIRRFDRGGHILASFNARPRTFPKESSDLMPSFLLASRDHVGWFTEGNQYIEYSLAGGEVARYDGPAGVDPDRDICGVGLSQRNDLSVCVRRGGYWKVLSLNRTSRKWDVALPEEKGGAFLMGYDGETLVVSPSPSDAGGGWVVRRYSRPGERGDPAK